MHTDYVEYFYQNFCKWCMDWFNRRANENRKVFETIEKKWSVTTIYEYIIQL